MATNAPNGATKLPTFRYTLVLRLDTDTDELLMEYRCGERVKRHRLTRADRAAYEQVLGRVPAAPVEPGDER